jgi:ribonucleoside-diphosphate reductase alpha chain
VSANDLTPDDHVKVQALIQAYTDSSISKTVNAPSNHTVEDVEKLYMDAYDLGCKGVTYMRDGSRTGVLSHIEEKKEEVKVEVKPEIAARPMVLRGRTYKVMTPMGEAFMTVNRDENDSPFEVFINIGKGGMHTMADAEAIGRLISLALRTANGNRGDVAWKIVSQLRGIGGASHVNLYPKCTI